MTVSQRGVSNKHCLLPLFFISGWDIDAYIAAQKEKDNKVLNCYFFLKSVQMSEQKTDVLLITNSLVGFNASVTVVKREF